MDINKLLDELSELKKQKEKLTKRENQIKTELLNYMETTKTDKITVKQTRIYYVGPTTRARVNGETLKNDYPEVYQKCLEYSPVRACVKVVKK